MALTTAQQLRAARAALRLEQQEVAEAAGVALGTIKRIEQSDGLIRAHLETVQKLEAAFDRLGIEFTNGGKPGVRLDMSKAQTANAAV